MDELSDFLAWLSGVLRSNTVCSLTCKIMKKTTATTTTTTMIMAAACVAYITSAPTPSLLSHTGPISAKNTYGCCYIIMRLESKQDPYKGKRTQVVERDMADELEEQPDRAYTSSLLGRC